MARQSSALLRALGVVVILQVTGAAEVLRADGTQEHVPKAHPERERLRDKSLSARLGLSMRISQRRQERREKEAATQALRSASRSQARSTRAACRAIEERSWINGTCRKASSLPDWCLPMFQDMNGVQLMAEAGQYIGSLKKQKFDFLVDLFRDLTGNSVKAWERTHWLHNLENRLGLHTLQYTKPRNALIAPRRRFPRRDLPSMFNFTTCAVVGSARMMLAKPYGEEIDAHNVIFRSNQAPTLGFQRYVGSRTDIRIVNPANTYFSEDGPKTSCLVPIVQKYQGNHVIMQVHQGMPKHEDRCRMLPSSPQLEAYRWMSLAGQVNNDPTQTRQAKSKMSSGFLAIAMAVQLCEKVDIYGYSFEGNYYFPKVHNGSPVDKKTGEKRRLKKGERVIHDAVKPPDDAGWDAADAPLQQRWKAQEAEEPGHRRRLQAIAKYGHPWTAEKACTGLLSALPKITWHQEKYDKNGNKQAPQHSNL